MHTVLLCFALLWLCNRSYWFHMKYLSIFIRVALLALGQSLDCHNASEVSLVDMGKSVNVLPQQSTAKQKPCAYFFGYTVYHYMYDNNKLSFVGVIHNAAFSITCYFRLRFTFSACLQMTWICTTGPGNGNIPTSVSTKELPYWWVNIFWIWVTKAQPLRRNLRVGGLGWGYIKVWNYTAMVVSYLPLPFDYHMYINSTK